MLLEPSYLASPRKIQRHRKIDWGVQETPPLYGLHNMSNLTISRNLPTESTNIVSITMEHSVHLPRNATIRFGFTAGVLFAVEVDASGFHVTKAWLQARYHSFLSGFSSSSFRGHLRHRKVSTIEELNSCRCSRSLIHDSPYMPPHFLSCTQN